MTAGSPVLTVRCDKFNPCLYLGATYSGSICLWDSRVNQHTPVQRTPLVSKGKLNNTPEVQRTPLVAKGKLNRARIHTE